MILSGKEILKHIGKEIQIEPFDENRLNPNSYNLSLAKKNDSVRKGNFKTHRERDPD